jgi:putative addiction module component (TIGR02574 family)
MSTSYQQLIESALALPASERVTLAEALLDSVNDDEAERLTGEEWEAAWKSEVQRRLDSVAAGTTRLHTWESVEERLNQKLTNAQNARHD